MFVRLSSFYCTIFFAVFLLPVLASAQWKASEDSEITQSTSDGAKQDVRFRISPRFQSVELPAPVDSTANGPVAPIRYNVATPAVRGQESGPTAGGLPMVQPHQAAAQASIQPAVMQPAVQPSLPAQLPATVQQAAPLPPGGPMNHAAQAQQAAPVQQAANFSSGDGTLPNAHGQVWREYDISPYTLRIQNVEQPEQAIVDWIIRETGTQLWFSEPLGILSANRTTLRVYHTPEMQQVVKDIVDRFVGGQTDAYSFGIRLLTVNNPNWRESLHRLMRPVSVQTPGIQAWIMSKEDASLLVSELSKRPDYREYNSTNLIIHNGQAGELAHVKPTSYIKNILASGDAFGSYLPEQGEIREGYNLSISPLVAGDSSVVDCVIKCSVDQVEELVNVNIDVPTVLNPDQQVQIQVPQIVSWRVHERFRWPADQVLVVSCGVVAKPGAAKQGLLGMRNVPNPFEKAPRADAMMILEAKGTVAAPLASQTPAGSGVSTPAFQTGAVNTYHGRY